MLSCAPVLLPFAAQQGLLGCWASLWAHPIGRSSLSTSRWGGGGSDPPSWSRLLFQVARTVSAARLLFCLVRIASYHVCSRGEHPRIALLYSIFGLQMLSR